MLLREKATCNREVKIVDGMGQMKQYGRLLAGKWGNRSLSLRF